MRTGTITFATTDASGDALERYLTPVLDAWPRTDATPKTHERSIEELTDGASSENARGPALIVLRSGESTSRAREIAEHLHRSLIPSVILADDPKRFRSSVEGGPVLVESHDADPAQTASMLVALAAAQGTMTELSRDLHIARMAQGGLMGEMDRMHEEMNLAAQVQRQFIAQSLPDTDGLEVGIMYRPAGYVSGDIYDVSRLDEKHVGVFVADAVGHGAPAALLTVVLSLGLKKKEIVGNEYRLLDPGEALSRLNKQMCERDNPQHRFATAAYAVLNLETREVTIASAGHPPAMRVKTGFASEVDVGGPLLGVFEMAEYESGSFTLDRDETLLIYSDGFETAFPRPDSKKNSVANDDYLRHLSRLADPVQLTAGGLPGAMDRLAKLLDEQAGSLRQIDDMTALAVRFLPEAGEIAQTAKRVA